MRGNYSQENEQFFIYRDGSPLLAGQITAVLKQVISNLGLQKEYYSMHSFRIGRSSDLIKSGHSVEEVQRAGRWKSNAVFRYIRNE